jgi:enoyl-CoA hydratase
VDLSTIQFKVSEEIAYLTLNRSPKNVMDALFFKEFAWLAAEVLPDLSVKGLIIQGSGRHFSSGTEIPELMTSTIAKQQDFREELFAKNAASFHILTSLAYPVVAAVRGCCLGSGMELALACHFRLASPVALFALPEAQFGLMPGCGGTIRLQELIGRRKAIELILTGKSLLAEEALAYGIVDQIVTNNKILRTAESLVNRLDHTEIITPAGNPPVHATSSGVNGARYETWVR